MEYYKIYKMDRTGHIAMAHDVRCDCDSSAMTLGEMEAGAFGVEVWQGARLIGRVGGHMPERAPHQHRQGA